MNESKMAEVAKLLGVELEEDFEIIGCRDRTFRLTQHGLCQLAKDGHYHSVDLDDSIMNTLDRLLSGILQIKKKPWKARDGETYYIPDISYVNDPVTTTNLISNADMICYDKGLMCKTKEQAIEIAEAMIKVAREMQGFEDNKED